MSTITDLENVGIRTPDTKLTECRRYDVPVSPLPDDDKSDLGEQHVLAMFCYEDPDSVVGRFVRKTAGAIAKQQTPVHVFSRQPFKLDSPDACVHPVGACNAGDLLGQVHEFTRRVCNAFLQQFHACSAHVTLMGHEWSAIPAISLLHGIKNVGAIVSLHSLERQRSGLNSETGKWIEETELSGLREAKLILIHEPHTAEIIGHCVPDCADRIADACPETPMEHFQFNLDPGDVKARFQVGPVDPTILYVGDLDERYGPHLLMKSMPAVLKNHHQARCIFVGDGELLWPLRVYSRYLLLDHAVRLAGHLAEQALYEVIHAADVIAVPSTEQTPWWPIEAAWAATRPVVATCEAAPLLLQHEKDCVLVQPDEKSFASGIERVLSDPEFADSIARRGRAKLEQRYSENKVVAQIEEAMGIQLPV